MPKKSSHRAEQVGDELQRELARLIQAEVSDPRLQHITLIDATMSPDLSHATIFFSTYKETEVAPALQAFEKATGFLRHKVGKILKLRIVPTLHFKYDESIIKGQKLSALIDKAIENEEPLNELENQAVRKLTTDREPHEE
jgi:ribosome-binding factor A